MSLEVFDLTGHRVAERERGDLAAGRYAAQWDGVGERVRVATGIYFVRLSAPGHEIRTARLVIAR